MKAPPSPPVSTAGATNVNARGLLTTGVFRPDDGVAGFFSSTMRGCTHVPSLFFWFPRASSIDSVGLLVVVSKPGRSVGVRGVWRRDRRSPPAEFRLPEVDTVPEGLVLRETVRVPLECRECRGADVGVSSTGVSCGILKAVTGVTLKYWQVRTHAMTLHLPRGHRGRGFSEG
jgi:hypothetical protein